MKMKTTTLLLLITLGLWPFACSPMVQAVVTDPLGYFPGGNTAEGEKALFSLTSGTYNTAIGFFSLKSNITGNLNTSVGAGVLIANTADENTAIGAGALLSNMTGAGNTADGAFALFSNTIGTGNTATGLQALFSNTNGIRNTANGVYALDHNIAGSGNTAIGYQALANNTADGNTAIGNDSLVFNTIGVNNTATGAGALLSNISGQYNTAIGFQALYSNTDGHNNAATGRFALYHNASGYGNTATGVGALLSNTTGNSNTATGGSALFNNITGTGNTATGTGALASNTGSNNIALGYQAGAFLTTGDNNIDIGNAGVAAESNTIRIGTQGTQTASYVAGIFGATVTDGAPVIVDTNGHLGTVVSSARFKDEIKPMDKASSVILALKPVTFCYKKERDPKRIPQFGLVAEDVEKTDPDLVIRDRDGKPYTVRYDAVNAMLLNEFLKEHRRVQEQDHKLQGQEATIAKQQKQIEALTAGLQKVSCQLELIKPAPQMVLNKE